MNNSREEWLFWFRSKGSLFRFRIRDHSNQGHGHSHKRQLRSLIEWLAKVQKIIRENEWHSELGSEFSQPFDSYKLGINLAGNPDKKQWNSRNFGKVFLKQHLHFIDTRSEELFKRLTDIFMGSDSFANLFFKLAFQNKGLQIHLASKYIDEGSEIIMTLSLAAPNAQNPVAITAYVYDNNLEFLARAWDDVTTQATKEWNIVDSNADAIETDPTTGLAMSTKDSMADQRRHADALAAGSIRTCAQPLQGSVSQPLENIREQNHQYRSEEL